MLVTLSALYAYPSGFVAAAGTFQPSAFGAGPGCTDLGRRLARHRVEATAVCFDRQLVSPHDGSSHESTAETAGAERAVTRKTVPGGASLDCRESSTDSRARARIDPALLAPAWHPPTHPFHTYTDHHAWSSTKMFGVILGLAAGPRAALSRDECSRKTMLYSLALLLISRPGARAQMGGGPCTNTDNGAEDSQAPPYSCGWYFSNQVS